MGTKKRKKSISPNPSKSLENKKVKTDEEIISDDLQATETIQSDATQEKDKPAKPIYVSANIQDTKKVISSLKMATRVLCKIRGTNCTQISCFNIKDKKILIEKLTSEQIEYHTFTEKCEKPNKFILKGFYDVTNEELLQMLKKEDIPAIKVTEFIRKKEFIWFMVQFDKTITLDSLNRLHRSVDGIMIRWENLKKSSKNAT